MLFEYLMIEITKNGEMNGLGAHQFKAPLHRGDFVIMDNKGEEDKYFGGKAYEVVAVKLATGAPAAGDLIVKLIGGDEDLNEQLRSENTVIKREPRRISGPDNS